MATHVVSSNEPTASLVSLELACWWAHPQAKGKRKADDPEEADHDNNTTRAGEEGSLPKTHSSQTPQGDSADEPVDIKKSALHQIAATMPDVLRRSMIR